MFLPLYPLNHLKTIEESVLDAPKKNINLVRFVTQIRRENFHFTVDIPDSGAFDRDQRFPGLETS